MTHDNELALLEEFKVEAEEVIESFDAIYLDASSIHFEHDGENLTMRSDEGEYYPRVILRQCFPVSSSDYFLVVRTPETEEDLGKELGIINDFENLDVNSQDSILGELKVHYFVPVIGQVMKIKEEFGFLYWVVETDRGIKEFIMRDNIIHASRQISDNRWLLIDINNARYEIKDTTTLDKHSKKLLDRYLLL